MGLAAPQVGVNVRLMVFNESGKRGAGSEVILVNPEIVASSTVTELDVEGCLSFPTIYADVERPRDITVKAVNERGEPVSLSLTGFAARVFQHEYDHLTGTLYHDRMKPAALKTVREALVALETEFAAAHPGVKFQKVAPESKGFGK